MLLLPWILLVGCTADKLPADDSAPSEAFPCTNFSGDATFERVHGEIDGYVLVPWYDPAGEEAGVLVLDSDGCSRMSIEVPPFVTVAKWRGDRIWYNQMGGGHTIHNVDMVTGEEQVLDVPTHHHDFLLHDDGTLAWLAEEPREIDGEQVLGDIIRESAPDGTVTDIWNAHDDIEVERHRQWDIADPHEWTHANGLAWDPDTESYLVSLYFLKEIVEVNRASGTHTRRLHGDEQHDPFGFQHGPSVRPSGGIRMFDNGPAKGASRLLEIGWDGEVIWEWESEDGLTTQLLGDMYVREDGVVLASYGVEGVILAVKDGVEIWRVSSPGAVTGRLDWRAELPG